MSADYCLVLFAKPPSGFPALEVIALRICVAALCSDRPTHFLAIFDVEPLTMLLALARDHGGPTAEDALAVAESAHLVAPLLGDLGAPGKFILDLAHQAVGYFTRSSTPIVSSTVDPSWE